MTQQCLIFEAFLHKKNIFFKHYLMSLLTEDIFLKSLLFPLCAKETEFQMVKVLEDW